MLHFAPGVANDTTNGSEKEFVNYVSSPELSAGLLLCGDEFFEKDSGRHGQRLELKVNYLAGRKNLPFVELNRAA